MPEYLSHSALNQYLTCSWQYKLERIDKIPAAPAWFFIGGSAVHKATEWMDQRNAYPYSGAMLNHLWSKAFAEEIDEAYKLWPNDEEWRQAGRVSATWPEGQRYEYWDQRGLAAVKAWQDWRTATGDKYSISLIEHEFRLALPSGIEIKGFIDRVMLFSGTTVAFPLDIKSGTKRPASPLQLSIYRNALELEFPHNRVDTHGAWWMAKDGEAYFVPADHITLKVLDDMATAYFRGVENKVFIPNPGDACRTCPFTKQCPAFKENM